MKRMRRPAVTLVALVALSACAAGAPGRPHRNSSIISQEEIQEAGPQSVYDLVQGRRPLWLRERGNTSTRALSDNLKVYLDNMLYGSAESLREIYTSEVERVEYLDARRATVRFGAGHPNGAIVLHTPSGRSGSEKL